MTDHYAVMGDPVSHSKSPAIHAEFARQCRQDLRYTAIRVPSGELRAAVERFRAGGGRGLNITVPLKEEASGLGAQPSARAARAGAANTLKLEPDGRLWADNTDGPGLLRDLTGNHRVELRGRRLLLLGAGGATRGILGPLLDAGPHEVVVANRTVERARELVARFACAVPLSACGFESLQGERFELVVNATAAGIHGQLPPLPAGILAPGAVCYDLMYGAGAAPFLSWAGEQGAALAVDGLGMLVEQAAESFLLWRDVRPETAAVIAMLRAAPG